MTPTLLVIGLTCCGAVVVVVSLAIRSVERREHERVDWEQYDELWWREMKRRERFEIELVAQMQAGEWRGN